MVEINVQVYKIFGNNQNQRIFDDGFYAENSCQDIELSCFGLKIKFECGVCELKKTAANKREYFTVFCGSYLYQCAVDWE